MVKVRIWGSLQAAVDNQAEIDIDASTARELINRMVDIYPKLAPQVERGISLAIDGLIYREAWFTPIKPDSEVVLMPYMVGG